MTPPDPPEDRAPATLNATNQYQVVHNICLSHIWQEFHKDASTTIYNGPTADDHRVVENPDASGNLQAKGRMHLCFHERAIATIDVNVGSGTLYAQWQIIDANNNVVKEHPEFTTANYDSNNANARLQTGKYGWLWDGRNNEANPVFCAAGTYRSHITIKDNAGTQVQQLDAPIDLEGDPYHIFIVGQPKTNNELMAEFTRSALSNRFLHTNGRRTACDCWIIVHRGEENSEGHIVFLGQGAEEATKTEDPSNYGAIATPHDREFKGWIRPDPHGDSTNYDRIQIEDLGRTDGRIILENSGGPEPNNPYSSSRGPYKDGVQAHGQTPTYAGGRIWTSDGLSIGCTTVNPINNATVTSPGSVLGRVRSINSCFGDWGTNSSEDVSVEGPDFVNKQTKRNCTDDTLIVDDHNAPELDPPQCPAPTTGSPPPDEPLHMQSTVQQAVFGGFKGYEIPRSDSVANDPINQLRIRMTLGDYTPGSMYYLYHRAVVFGHTWEQNGNEFLLTVWIPRKVIRVWNGNPRNILIRGHCQIAWYIERRTEGEDPVRFPIYPGSAGNYAALPNNFIGRRQETWNLPQPLDPGDYVSVFRYRVELLPQPSTSSIWSPEGGATDLFSSPNALIADETIVNVGSRRYIEGGSELLITTV